MYVSASGEISQREATAGCGVRPSGPAVTRPSASARMMKNSSGSVAVAGSRSAGSLRWLSRRTWGAVSEGGAGFFLAQAERKKTQRTAESSAKGPERRNRGLAEAGGREVGMGESVEGGSETLPYFSRET